MALAVNSNKLAFFCSYSLSTSNCLIQIKLVDANKIEKSKNKL